MNVAFPRRPTPTANPVKSRQTHLDAGDFIPGQASNLGPDFETAWNAGENLKEDSAEAKALSDALDKLDAKCPGAATEGDKK